MDGSPSHAPPRGGLTDLSDDQVGQVELARARAHRRADRRELLTEAAAGALFVVAACAIWAFLPHAGGDAWVAVALTALCAALIFVEFEVGEGCTRPIQLALVPMLVLLPAPWVPPAVVAAHVAARLPDVALRRVPAQRLLLAAGDSWFAVAPALAVALLSGRAGLRCDALVVGVALAVQLAADFAISSVRIWASVGVTPHSQLRAYAWVYLVDALLTPVGLLAAAAGRSHPPALAAVVPLAALLAVFARERRGRIENALALQRVAQEGRDRLESIVQSSSDLIVILAADGTMTTVTGSVEPVFGHDGTAARGEPLLDRVHPADRALVAGFLASLGTRPSGEPQEVEFRLRFADGSHRHIAGMATNLLGDPRVNGIVLTARDVDARKALEEQLRHRAFHDPLTGLANRALFYDRVEHALSRATRDDGHVAVLFVDLDDFKPVNDRRGHATGDRLLEEVARRLDACVRAADTVARLGGDEFGVLLEAVNGPADAFETAERILDAVAAPVRIDDEAIPVSASIGVASSAAGERGIEELLRRGDLAMYAAKAHGKARIELYDPDLERVDTAAREPGRWFRGREEQREEILSILEDPDALVMVFQPIMDLRTGRAAGYEALARFQRTPQRPPNEWFAQAHRCGLGYTLEAHAIAKALATPGRPAGTYLTVNLSPSSLVNDEVQRALPDQLDDLVIEITENELVSEDPEVLAAIAALRARGARLAVDDTGAGYAGLTHVMRLAPDVIKLDRALTTGVDSDPVKAALVGSFVRYARDIHATVCAEGIETAGELARLADLDVAFGQGYLIARPGPPWTAVSPEAAATCLSSFQAALLDWDATTEPTDHDRRLERLAARVTRSASATELAATLPSLARELNADEARIDAAPASSGIHQLLVGDASAAERERLVERGYGARLTIPVQRGDGMAALELYSRSERPWTRHQITRAALIAHAVGAALERAAR